MPPHITDAELIRRAIESRIADVYTGCPGRVEAYDATTRTADVQPLIRRRIADENGDPVFEDLPICPAVPVLFPGNAQGIMISWPLPKGSLGEIRFQHSDIGTWQAGGGEPVDPQDPRMHSLSHGVFYPGLAYDKLSTPQTAVDALVLAAATVLLGDHTASDFVALAGLVKARLDTIQGKYDSHVHDDPASGVTSAPKAPNVIGPLADVAATKVKAI